MNNDSELTKKFWEAPSEALFPQKVIALVLDLSEKWFERKRWMGDGIKYIKLGSRVKYRKSDVLAYIDQQKTRSSSSES